MEEIENAIQKIHEAVLAMDQIPYEEDYKRDKEINDIYYDLNECELKLRILNGE